jgi:hypothetical protein
MNRILIVLLFVVGYQSAFGQGQLSPTAAPAPTMKSLSQIEPRTPISALPYTISTAGSYYLTTNTTCTTCTGGTNGITILVNDVTLDLSGFTLLRVAGSGSGVNGAGAGHNYIIRNGTLRNWGADGVNLSGSINSQFQSLRFYANANIGLAAGMGSVVVNCEAYSNTVAGFELAGGEMSHCVAVRNGTGIVASTGCVLDDCSARSNASAGFLLVGTGVEISRCAAADNYAFGILTSSGCVVADCTASGNGGDGINVGFGTLI